MSQENIVAREMALIKVRTTAHNRSEVIQIVDIFRANIVDVATDSLIIEVTGDEDKVDSLYELLNAFGVSEVMRTGRVAMMRGALSGQASRNGRSKGNGAAHLEEIDA